MIDILFPTLHQGLLLIDIPMSQGVSSGFVNFSITFWLIMLLVNLVLGVIKRLPVM